MSEWETFKEGEGRGLIQSNAQYRAYYNVVWGKWPLSAHPFAHDVHPGIPKTPRYSHLC